MPDQLVQLRAVPPFKDPHGRVRWDPNQGRLQLFASDLPPLPAGAVYRVRFRLDDGRLQTGPTLYPGTDGAVSGAVAIGGDAPRLQEIQVVLDPPARPVLAGRADGGAP